MRPTGVLRPGQEDQDEAFGKAWEWMSTTANARGWAGTDEHLSAQMKIADALTMSTNTQGFWNWLVNNYELGPSTDTESLPLPEGWAKLTKVFAMAGNTTTTVEEARELGKPTVMIKAAAEKTATEIADKGANNVGHSPTMGDRRGRGPRPGQSGQGSKVMTPTQRGIVEALGITIASVGGWIWWIKTVPEFQLGRAKQPLAPPNGKGMDNTPGPTEKIALIVLAWTVLEPLRRQFGPLRITSGYRSPEVQALVSTSTTSSHPDGRAADLYTWDNSASHEDMATWIHANQEQFPNLDQTIVEYHTGHLHLGIAPNSASATPRGQFRSTTDGISYQTWEPT